jgi:hypothetical protein
MRPEWARWILGSLLGLAIVGVGGVLSADEPPSDRMLQKHGLKRNGPVFILEAETPALEKAKEVRDLSQQLRNAVAKQKATASEKDYQATVKEANDELNYLKNQSNIVSQDINRLPKWRGRPVNYQQYQELTYTRNMLQQEIGQRTNFLNQLKSNPFDPKARVKADAEVQSKKDALRQGAQELRKLGDEVKAKYEEVGKDTDVQKWLATPEGPAAVKPRLGPSRAFILDEKMLEKVERDTSSDDAFASPSTTTKSTKKGKRSSKVKRPAGSTDPNSPF